MAARIIAIAVLAAAITAALATAAILLFGRPSPVAVEDGSLERSFSAHTTFQQERFQRLELAARLLAEDRVLLAGSIAPDADTDTDADADADPVPDPVPEQLATLLRRRLPRLGCDVAMLVAADGTVLARSDSRQGTSSAGLAAAVGGPSDDPTAAVWEEEGRLYYAARAPVAPDFQHYAVAAMAVDDLLALEIERAGGAEVAFFAASAVGAQLVGTSDSARAQALLGQMGGLGGPGGQLERVLGGGGPVPDVELAAAGTTYRALLAALDDASGDPVGAIVLFSAVRATAGSSRLPALAALGAGLLLALLAAIPLALATARRAAGPVDRLVGSVDAVRAGDPSQRTAGWAGGALAPLARSLDRLFGDLHERQSLAAVASAAARGQAAGAEPVELPEEGRRTLLAADLRRFAGTQEADAEETVSRWQRDVRRFAAEVESRGGRFEGALGHRALASFEGEDEAQRALTVAAKSLLALGERDNAFDEGDPPALAVADGKVTHGRVGLTGGSQRVVTGGVLQLLESLLREAQPGEIVLSPPLARRVAPTLERAGAAPVERAGILSPRPVPVLTGDAAGRLAARAPSVGDETRVEVGFTRPGVAEAPPAPDAGDGAGDGAGGPEDPAALSVGDTVGGRFEVLEVLGTNPVGALLRARDRELGEVVALKVLAPAATADPQAFERLDSPLQPVRKLDHPSIARTYDYGRAGELAFFAREPVAGVGLERLFESPGRLPAPATLGLARQLAGALGSAHRDGVAHGRLTPGNVLVGADGRARITDFGVAMAVVDDPELRSGPGLAPEGGATPAGDVYAAAAITLRALTGAWPAGGEPPPDGLPEGLGPVLAAALADNPAERPSDGDELARALEPVFA